MLQCSNLALSLFPYQVYRDSSSSKLIRDEAQREGEEALDDSGASLYKERRCSKLFVIEVEGEEVLDAYAAFIIRRIHHFH